MCCYNTYILRQLTFAQYPGNDLTILDSSESNSTSLFSLVAVADDPVSSVPGDRQSSKRVFMNVDPSITSIFIVEENRVGDGGTLRRLWAPAM